MRRREAILVFREICECIPDVFINSITLSPSMPSLRDFVLRLNMSLNNRNLVSVQSIVNKHGLSMKENKGFVLIYGSGTHVTHPTEIEMIS